MIENKPNIRKPDKMEMNNVVLEENISVILLEHPWKENKSEKEIIYRFTSINKDSLFLLHFWRLFVPKYLGRIFDIFLSSPDK